MIQPCEVTADVATISFVGMSMGDASGDAVLPTLAYAQVDELLVLCYSPVSPRAADWEVWIARSCQHRHSALLISSRGGAPNARQRAQFAERASAIPMRRPPVALLTDSTLLRSVMTAFSWLQGDRSPPMKAFAPEAVDAALEWLKVQTAPERVRAIEARLHEALDAAQAKLATARSA